MALSAAPAMPSLLRSSSAAGSLQSPVQSRLRALAASTQLAGKHHTQGPVAASANVARAGVLAREPGRPWPPQSRSLRGLGDRRKPSASSTRTLASRPIVANWNQEVAWEDVEVSSVQKEAELLYAITLNIKLNTKLQEGYTKAGQFVQVKIGDSKPAFLAIASPPQAAREGRMEFLVKAVEGSTAELLTRVQAGQLVQVSQVMGKGFNADALGTPEDCSSVLLFATGSGISPIRALIEAGFDATQRRDVRLYFGVQDLPYIPYEDKFKAWEESGVQIIKVLSQPPPGWQGEAGRVQDAFQRTSMALEGASTGAVLCGHKGMAEDVTSLLKDKGVAPERILLNF